MIFQATDLFSYLHCVCNVNLFYVLSFNIISNSVAFDQKFMKIFLGSFPNTVHSESVYTKYCLKIIKLLLVYKTKCKTHSAN